MRWTAPWAFLFCAGCLTSQEDYLLLLERSTDWDLDGHSPPKHGGADCDDDRADIYPGAAEDECDGADEDCDGIVDEGVTVLYFPDDDGDGFGRTAEGVESCEPPVVGAWSYLDGDCEDSDASVNPDAEELCNDGLDNDCDGQAGECALEASGLLTELGFRIAGQSNFTELGEGVGFATEYLGTHTLALVWGEDSADGYGVASPVLNDMTVSDAITHFGLFGGYGGGVYFIADVVEVGDLDGESGPELAISVYSDDEDVAGVHLRPLRLGLSYTSPEDDLAILLAGEDYRSAGFGVASGELTGDGLADVVIHPRSADGSVLLFAGPWTGRTLGIDDRAFSLSTTETFTIGYDAVADDINGDGIDDLISTVSRLGDTSLVAVAQLGPLAEDVEANEADRTFSIDYGEIWGVSIDVGDLDGDGASEVLISGSNGETPFAAGEVMAFSPRESGQRAVSPRLRIAGDQEDAFFGWDLEVADLNGDERDDVLVSTPVYNVDPYGEEVGGVWLFQSPESGVWEVADADAAMLGGRSDDWAGFSIAITPDLTGDDIPDILVGVPGDDTLAQDAGAAYLIPFTSL